MLATLVLIASAGAVIHADEGRAQPIIAQALSAEHSTRELHSGSDGGAAASRIDENEVAAIEACRFLMSERATEPSDTTETPALSGGLGDETVVAFHGYYIRRLAAASAQDAAGARLASAVPPRDGYAVLAYPAQYRVTGVMTFALGPDGALYESDLGSDTIEVARQLRAPDLRHAWHRVEGR